MSKKVDLDIIAATRLLALWNVSRPTEKQESDYVYRVMARWFARECNYRLEDVDEVPIEIIAQNYYEAHYEDMTPEQREEEMKRLTQSEEERVKAEKADDEFLKKAIKDAEETAKLQATTSALKEAAAELTEVAKQVLQPKQTEQLKEEFKQPEIDMKFISPEEAAKMDDWDILGPIPSSGK
jgi:hypothetical protein